jgi:hypothetical protein
MIVTSPRFGDTKSDNHYDIPENIHLLLDINFVGCILVYHLIYHILINKTCLLYSLSVEYSGVMLSKITPQHNNKTIITKSITPFPIVISIISDGSPSTRGSFLGYARPNGSRLRCAVRARGRMMCSAAGSIHLLMAFLSSLLAWYLVENVPHTF